MDFKIKNDYEFYCYLKARLPKKYKIIAEPSPHYYSEWFFNYKIYYNNKLVDKISGNFRNIKKGELVKKAKKIISRINKKL
jgi:hypothetical protein